MLIFVSGFNVLPEYFSDSILHHESTDGFDT